MAHLRKDLTNRTLLAFSAQKKSTVPTKQEKYAVASMQVTFVSRMISFCSDLGKVLPENKMAQKQQTLDMLVTQNSRISMVLALIQVRPVLELKFIIKNRYGVNPLTYFRATSNDFFSTNTYSPKFTFIDEHFGPIHQNFVTNLV